MISEIKKIISERILERKLLRIPRTSTEMAMHSKQRKFHFRGPLNIASDL